MKKSFSIRLVLCTIMAMTLSSCSYNGGAEYKITAEAVLQTIRSGDYLVSPDEAAALASEPAHLFVDLRSPVDYARGHIEGAVNVPIQNLLEKENKSRFQDATQTFILYGDTELAANGPWVLLRQLGYENIKVLQGGYTYWSDWEQDGNYLSEIPQYPYDSLFTLATQRTRMEEEALHAKPVVVNQAPMAQKKIVPKKKKVVEEEEEGC